MARFDLIHFAKNIPEQHTIRDISILHDLPKNQCPNLHQKRLSSLMIAVQSLLDGQQCSALIQQDTSIKARIQIISAPLIVNR